MKEETFGEAVSRILVFKKISRRELATEFEVAESTVGRWIRGTSRPHPKVKLQIIKWLANETRR